MTSGDAAVLHAISYKAEAWIKENVCDASDLLFYFVFYNLPRLAATARELLTLSDANLDLNLFPRTWEPGRELGREQSASSTHAFALNLSGMRFARSAGLSPMCNDVDR